MLLRSASISLCPGPCLSTRFFTNDGANTLLKKFAGVFEHNPDIERFDALVGYLRASGYFALRPHLEKVPFIRVMVGIDVDKIVANYHRKGLLFLTDRTAKRSAAVNPPEFIYDFLTCFGISKATIAPLKGVGGVNLAQKEGCTLLKTNGDFEPLRSDIRKPAASWRGGAHHHEIQHKRWRRALTARSKLISPF